MDSQSSPTSERLDAISKGFRSTFLDHEALCAQLADWHGAFPEITRLHTLGRSVEGRALLCLAIGRDPDGSRPAAWVDGNMHASELCGSSVALAIAEDLLRLHGGLPAADLPEHLARGLLDVTVYVMPRISPDGAEAVLKTGRYVRSSPQDDRRDRGVAYWQSADVDGDGFIGRLRVEHPDGEFVGSKEVPGLLLPRQLEDEGPFYKVYPEGLVENFDGHNIPSPYFLSDNRYDLNRTFPWNWAPEQLQAGAGDYPGALPETRAILEFVCSKPNLHVWMNYHTFGGVIIRPLGDKPDAKMNQADLAIFRQLEFWSDKYSGYPTVSGYEDFLYQPDTPLRGDLSDFAYHQRGCLSVVTELWDLFKQLGMERTKPFSAVYERSTPEDFARLWKWDAEHNAGRIFRPWMPFDHPQLGRVELGGYDTRYGIWNPPFDRIEAICQAQSAIFLRMASLVPRVVIDEVVVTSLGDACRQVDLRVRNAGYLATYGIPSAKTLPFSETLRLTATSADPGTVVVSPAERGLDLGHLEGWGRGRHGGDFGLAFLETHGTDGERRVRLIVRGPGAVTVSVACPRTGRTEVVVPGL